MLSNKIQCTYCGLSGEIGGFNSNTAYNAAKIFKHLGHNPFSGHLHYQCPFCFVVLLVPPMDVLDGKALYGTPSLPVHMDSILTNLSQFFYKVTGAQKSPHSTRILR